MASTKYEVYVRGAGQAAGNLNRLANNMFSFEPAFSDIGEYFREQVETQFDLRGALPGIRGPWKPLRPLTIKLRGGSSQPLVRKGALKASWLGGPRHVSDIGPRSARFGTGHKAKPNKGNLQPTAVYHQVGTRKMAARPVVLGNKYLDEDILDAFTDQLFGEWI